MFIYITNVNDLYYENIFKVLIISVLCLFLKVVNLQILKKDKLERGLQMMLEMIKWKIMKKK
jgi:hypothetical protein